MRAPTVAMVLVAGLGLAAAALVWDRTWDDSAITLGYARTLAETGTLAFGRHGERVEGSSTFLWTLVCAVLALAARTPDGLLDAARGACAVLYLANGALVHRLARRSGLGEGAAAAVTAACLGLAAFVVSIPDGTENHLFLTLNLATALALAAALDGGAARVAPLTGLAVFPFLAFLCRPEGTLTWAALVVALALQRDRVPAPQRARVVAVLAAGLVLMAAFVAWRFSYFGALAPNTVYAKTWPPYFAPLLDRMRSGAGADAHALLAGVGWLLPVAVTGPGRLRGLVRSLASAFREQPFTAALAAAFALYHLGTGAPRGTANRIWMAALPLVLIAVWKGVAAQPWTRERWRVALAAVVFLLIQSRDVRTYAAAPITVPAVQALVEPAARLLALTGPRARPPRLAVPDTGATLLYWGDTLAIVDLALLNNRKGAHEGWRASRETLFEGEPPDLIETHPPWTALNGLGGDARVRDAYERISIDGRFYLARRDLVARLRSAPPPGVRVVPASDLDPAEREAMRSRVFTDFRAGAAALPLPWTWAVSLPSAE